MLTMEYIKENEKTYQVQIEELTNRVEYEQRRNQRKDKEIERLNNIINEFDKWLDKKEKLTFNSWNKGIHEVRRKLQELKGSDKE